MKLQVVPNPQKGKLGHKVAALVTDSPEGYFVAKDSEMGGEWTTDRLYLVLRPVAVAAIEGGLHMPRDYVEPSSETDTFRPRSYVSLVVSMDSDAEVFVHVRSAIEHEAPERAVVPSV